MQIQFWGTRGSIAKPGPKTARYGGNTSCVEVRSARGTLVVIDCGTGGHPLGQKLMPSGVKGLRGHILISHTHWDHIQGIPFFAPLFVPGNQWDVYGPKGLDQSLRETLAGQMQHAYFPVTPDQFGATIRYHDLVEGNFEIEDIKVSTRYLNHPALTLGYRLEADGATLVYCCDHEPFSRSLGGGGGDITGQDLRHAEFIRGADLLIHDAQYTAAEYPNRIGWGHSSVEYVVRLAEHAGVKRVALTHHDPLRDDDAIDGILMATRAALKAAGAKLEVLGAAEGQMIEVQSSDRMAVGPVPAEFQAMSNITPAMTERSVLLFVADPGMAAGLSDAVRAEGIQANFVSTLAEAEKLIAKDPPSLAILEDSIIGGGLSVCRALRQAEGDQFPIVMVAAQEDSAAGAAADVTEWLIKPFSSSYVRTKIRAWVLRTACRWMRGRIPANEAQRIAALRELGILDTAQEPRFDRITRLAAALFGVPMVIISLIDEDRQWFKSCIGLTSRETSRDAAFCAHVVFSREMMVVPDTFLDARFADNPLVTSEPRIRFYAGYPLIRGDGYCIGTLCLLDTRPRTMDASDLERLGDLAAIAIKEIGG